MMQFVAVAKNGAMAFQGKALPRGDAERMGVDESG